MKLVVIGCGRVGAAVARDFSAEGWDVTAIDEKEEALSRPGILAELKPGRELHDKVESWLAWQRVKKEIDDGTLGGDFDRTDRAELQVKVKDSEESAKDEVWASYRYVVIADSHETDGLKIIDLGAGHASASETLCGRIIAALKSQGLLSESVGAGYIERNWPPALKETGAWPLASLRQSFLNGALTRMLDPDTVAVRPGQQDAADILGAVVAPNDRRRPTPLDNLLERTDHPGRRQRQIGLNAQTLSIEVIVHVDEPKAAPVA